MGSKVCPNCSTENADGAGECEGCGAPLRLGGADALVGGCSPTPLAAEFGGRACAVGEGDCGGKPLLTLVGVVGGEEIEIPAGGCMIGREGGFAPHVFGHEWVSSMHCRLTADGGDFYVEDIGSEGNGSTNGTFIDGNRLPARTPVKIHNGSRLMIAHLMFDVRVLLPQAASTDAAGNFASVEGADHRAGVGEDAVDMIWVIECPSSGERHVVEGASARIRTCTCCADAMDKKRISAVKPKQVKVI